jgi:hypothetical protein
MIELPPHIRKLVDALTGRAEGAPGLRRAALVRAAADAGVPLDGFEPGEPLSAPVAAWVDAVAQRAWEITDDDVARLRDAGVDEDLIFELTVAAAVGASLARMQAGLRALKEAR